MVKWFKIMLMRGLDFLIIKNMTLGERVIEIALLELQTIHSWRYYCHDCTAECYKINKTSAARVKTS
jgi:hypothetical protein